MSESEADEHGQPIYGFTESFKLAHPCERIVSPRIIEYERKLRVLAWSVRWVLSVRIDTKPIRIQIETRAFTKYMTGQDPTFVLYRRQMLELLRWPKPAFDQLALELPCLMGFRAKEVTTWRAEYIDYVHGDTLVLDAKKHRLYSVPLNTQVAKHAMDVLGSRGEGYVLQSRSNRQQDPEKPLTTIAVWYIWNKWTRTTGLSESDKISPVVGRRFFAAEWYYHQGLSLETLRRILRHTSLETTTRYVASLVFHEDVKRDYDKFQLGLIEEERVPHDPLPC